MSLQHAENLLRRYKGQVLTFKMISGAAHEGRLTEITNDFVELIEVTADAESIHVFLLFQAIESFEVPNQPASG
jgi:hypothetical protein